MQIPRDKAAMLIDLSAKVKKHLGINIGYIHPKAAFMDDKSEFIIREPINEDDELQVIHKNDLMIQQQGNIMTHEVVEFPQHDDQVEELFDKIDEAILDGTITFDPGVTKTINNIEMSVTQRDLTEYIGKIVYELPIVTPQGNLYTYTAICQMAEYDERFKVAKQIIDEVWPEESERQLRKNVAEQADVPAVKPAETYQPSKLWKKLVDWLNGDG